VFCPLRSLKKIVFMSGEYLRPVIRVSLSKITFLLASSNGGSH
jgi:hypothetical protein